MLINVNIPKHPILDESDMNVANPDITRWLQIVFMIDHRCHGRVIDRCCTSLAPRSLLLKNLHFYSPTNMHKVTKWRLGSLGVSSWNITGNDSFFAVLSGRFHIKRVGWLGVGGEAITSELLTDSLSASRFTSSSGESRCVTGSLRCWPFTSSHLPVFIASCFHSNVERTAILD